MLFVLFHFKDLADLEIPSLLDSVLYEGTAATVRQSIRDYLNVFLDKSDSKEALSDYLNVSSSLLPHPNRLPESYNSMVMMIADELLTVHKKHVCLNDCMFFTDPQQQGCLKCGSQRFRQDSMGRRIAVKYFSHVSIKESLNRLFGCSNIAKIMQAAGGGSLNTVTDIQETRKWQSWMETTPDETQIVLGFNTDG